MKTTKKKTKTLSPPIDKQQKAWIQICNSLVAKALLDTFPELGTDEEMNGADTVDKLCDLYDLAINGKLWKNELL